MREGVEVRKLDPAAGGGFRLDTSAGEIEARAVVLGAGAYRRPHRPMGARSLPADLLQIDVVEYVEPASLPRGPVLVVGSGQSGCQIAEELHESGREVFLSCGRAPWAPRRIGDPRPVLVARGGRDSGTNAGPPYAFEAGSTISPRGGATRWVQTLIAATAVPGAALSSPALITLILALVQGSSWGWGSPAVVCLLVASAVLFAAFALTERRSPNPMLDFSFFRRRNFTGAMTTVFATILLRRSTPADAARRAPGLLRSPQPPRSSGAAQPRRSRDAATLRKISVPPNRSTNHSESRGET